MRVAFDLSSTRGEKTGIGIYTDNLVRALRELPQRDEIKIVELADHAPANQRTDRRILREQFAIPRLIARAGVHLVHLTGFAAPRRAPRPVVLTVHDLIGVLFSKNFPPAARFYWSRYLPFTLRYPRRLIAESEHTKKDVVCLANVPADRVRVIPNGRDEMFQPIYDRNALERARARLGLPSTFLLFVSTLEPRKGVDTLIEAFARIAGAVPDELVIVGKRGWFWEKLIAQVQRAGLERRVRFLDYVPQEQLPVVYNLARAFVFPSRYEGFGFPPLEAMACGTPVICSNASSLPEVVGDAAILIPPHDGEGFARAMLQIVGNECLRAELRERGLRRAQVFSWERAARETLQVYREVVESA